MAVDIDGSENSSLYSLLKLSKSLAGCCFVNTEEWSPLHNQHHTRYRHIMDAEIFFSKKAILNN